MPSPNGFKKHNKQLMLELPKESVNEETIKKLQELSFTSLVEDISSNLKGHVVVSDVSQKNPFLQLEEQVKFAVMFTSSIRTNCGNCK